MMTGILHPTSGEVRVEGKSPQRPRREVVRRLGVVFGQRTQLWWDLPVATLLSSWRRCTASSQREYQATLTRFDDLLEIGAFFDVPVRKLSLGQRMRADLVAAWLHRRPSSFWTSLRSASTRWPKRGIRSFLQEINRTEGTTIMLTTHDMDDIEHLCTRVMVINHGRLVYDGSLEGLRQAVGAPSTLRIEYAAPPGTAPQGPWTLVSWEGNVVTIAFDRSRCTAADVIGRLGQYGESGTCTCRSLTLKASLSRCTAGADGRDVHVLGSGSLPSRAIFVKLKRNLPVVCGRPAEAAAHGRYPNRSKKGRDTYRWVGQAVIASQRLAQSFWCFCSVACRLGRRARQSRRWTAAADRPTRVAIAEFALLDEKGEAVLRSQAPDADLARMIARLVPAAIGAALSSRRSMMWSSLVKACALSLSQGVMRPPPSPERLRRWLAKGAWPTRSLRARPACSRPAWS